MSGVRRLRRFRLLLLVVVLFVLAAACDRTIPLGLPPPPCESRYTVEPSGPVVVSVGESRRLHVRVDTRNSELYQHCSRLFPGSSRVPSEWFNWSVEDSSVARIDQAEEGSEASVTITGLTVGQTWVVLQYSANAHPARRIRVEVVESAESEVGQVLQRSVSSISHSYQERDSVDTGCGKTVCPG